MRAADALALPSHNEGVPNVILEAFASGLRVVASRVGGIHEVHNHETLGRLVPAGELEPLVTALRETLETDPDTAAIRAHALRFSWEAATARYAEILKGAMAESV